LRRAQTAFMHSGDRRDRATNVWASVNIIGAP
jgi:hypothetical protein